MKRILGVEFNNREDAERMFMDEHPDTELGMTGRIIWLIVMIIFYWMHRLFRFLILF